MFGDWELSLAAYNSGEYRVARILADKKDVDDYWDMRERGYLPSETSAYVPKFLAAVQIARAPEDYGFESPDPHARALRDGRRRPSGVAARRGRLCGVSATELAELNPALRSGVTPSGYSLRVPAGKAEPLRIGLATYVEPVHARRSVARSTRGGRDAAQHRPRSRRRRRRSRRAGRARNASPARRRSAIAAATRPDRANGAHRLGSRLARPSSARRSAACTGDDRAAEKKAEPRRAARRRRRAPPRRADVGGRKTVPPARCERTPATAGTHRRRR